MKKNEGKLVWEKKKRRAEISWAFLLICFLAITGMC